jgi:membrane protease YdiL (CAAX protease family)
VIGVALFAIEGDDVDFAGAWLPAFVILPQIAVLVYVITAVRRKGRGPVADLDLRFEWIDLPLGLGIAFAALMAAGIVGFLVTELVGEDQTAAVAELVEESQGDGGLNVWIVLVAVGGALLVPFAEEILFRGLWWNALLKRGLSRGTALVVSSLLFTLFHLEPVRSPVLFVLGLALGWGRIWTGRLGTAIVTHGVINALAFTVLLVELA